MRESECSTSIAKIGTYLVLQSHLHWAIISTWLRW